MLPGRATPAGTAAYAAAHPAAPGHYRVAQGLTVSSLGMGTYLGEATPQARANYTQAAQVALAGGVNLLDTAANYRDQASERDLGKAIAAHVASGGAREGIVVASKAGFLHGDCDEADGDAWFRREYVDSGILRKDDVVSGHSLAPAFVAHQLERSRRNLGLECIDVLFLHNPEHQLEWGVPEAEFYGRVEAAFEVLERACDAGRIQMYGVATWDGLRVPPDRQGHLSLVRLVHHAGQARMRAGGKAGDHHFRALQLPVNLAMTEAALAPTQPFRFGAQTALDCAKDLGMPVLASASLMQMRVAGRVPPEMKQAFGTSSDAETALQFTRSVPGVTAALVGMGAPAHARANTAFAASRPPEPRTARTLLGTGSIHGA
ncbi:MAG TPA: aldo/keto reductase [Candidatus Thermoplasmatota archaeon]|nr:aldo/keto reductase [Candidatus Thermoplasmatota archaeon]